MQIVNDTIKKFFSFSLDKRRLGAQLAGWAFLFFFFLFISCRKNPSWDVDVLAPLLKSTMNINNIIPDSVIHKNPDNSLDIVYNSSLSSFSSEKLFKIPDTALTNNYISPFTTTINPGGDIIPLVVNDIKNSLGDAQLTNIILRNGKMLLTIKSKIKGLVDFTYTLPKVTSPSGTVFSITVTIPAATATTDGIYSGTFDLSGSKVDLTGPTGTSVNTMMTSYSAIVTPSANGGYTTTITAGTSVQILNTFSGIVPQYAKGYFGNSVKNLSDSTNFSLFRHLIGGTLNLEDVNIGLSIENSVGADARVTINDLSSVNSRTGNKVALIHSIIGSPININRSVDNNTTVTPSTYSVSFTPSNSNIKQFVENLPDKLNYQLDMEINPLGNVSGSNDFVYYDKLMKTNLNMTIPLSFVANNLTMGDTVNFKMASGTDNVNSGKLDLYFDNGFPFTAEAQLYLMDANLNLIDSLISIPNSISAPQLDVNSICAGKRETKLTIPLSQDKLNELRAAQKMYIKIKFNTANQPNYVKIYSFYEMKVQVVGDFNYTVGKK